jgi:hypothetical protein
MNKFMHTTKTGNKIALEDLKYSLLRNIIRMIERKAQKGITIRFGFMGDDPYYDEDHLTGEDALTHLNYQEYITEQKKRINEL